VVHKQIQRKYSVWI